MQKKVILQFFLFSIILGVSVIFYNVYFVDKKSNISPKNINKEKITGNDNNKNANIIHNIEYIAQDKKGSSYLIQSKFGKLSNDQSDLITLEEVTAVINFENSSPINIISDHALYNNTTHDTEFYGNVLVTYVGHNITSDNLNLYFQKDIANILNNVVYKNLNTTLEADKIEVDLLTKNSKIFMNNNFEKVKISKKNNGYN
jgi:lipopolysaccharide export system protein LptA